MADGIMKKNAESSGWPAWIGFVASRYIRRKGGRSSASSVLPVLGIATGVLALTVIIAVINGFQLGFIETILEVSSYHIRIDRFPAGRTDVLERLEKLEGVLSASPFREVKGMLKRSVEGRTGRPELAVLRALPADFLSRDRGLAGKIEIERGEADIAGERTILLGTEAAVRAGIRVGDRVEFISIANILPGVEGEGGGTLFTVAGLFRTGFYEYDTGWAFVNIDAATKYADAATFTVGIKLSNRWKLDEALGRIKRLISEECLASGVGVGTPGGLQVSTWRDYNKAFFGALRTEKLMMFVLVGLIFVVVALNIFQGQRRIVLEKRDEIGILRSVGASELDMRCVFALNGVMIGLAGALGGMIPALLIATHIRQFFTLIEAAVNFVLGLAALAGGGRHEGAFSVFSPTVFYIKEIPSRIIPGEVVLIFLFGFLSASLAAWLASGKVSAIKPAEALRNEQ
ncbi:MAG: ABC transporter permease [Spirochaetaceae bacterium]|jgi:lipoprotein-releasing system permease protein|nr:ABC transporter permease [Spirochaetaceae bacterium]